MAGANGDALEWALALAKAPSERVTLRHRPLPDGIETLLQIAAGHGEQSLEAATSRTGESREAILDAVRFYLREVLLHPDADAYRVLGLSRDADPARIKAHHRLLQHWLHPDRQTSEWDAAFAARVNAAWHQLRDPARRQAYDTAHPVEVDAMPGLALPLRGAAWQQALPEAEVTSSERWRQRIPLLALLLACVALGALALRDVQHDGGEAALPGMTERDPGAPGADPMGVDLHPSPVPAPHASPARPARPSPPMSSPAAPAPATVPAMADASRRVSAPRAPVATVAAPVGRDDKMSAPAPVMAARAVDVTPPSGTDAPAIQPAATPAPTVATRGAPRTAMALPTSTQVMLAQQAGERLLVFMRHDSRNVPPIWDSLSAQQGASQIRERLLSAGDVRFGSPEWRVDEESAAMHAGFRRQDGIEGRLAAELVWREERWLVRNLSLERDL